VYTAEAEKLGISLKECRHKVKDFSLTALPGDYRRLLVKPKEMSWQLLLYSHPDQDLAYTDLDALLGNPKPELDILSRGTSL
jgi:tRNA pseudouridine13 synthase